MKMHFVSAEWSWDSSFSIQSPNVTITFWRHTLQSMLGYLGVSLIHWTLTWIRRSLVCISEILACTVMYTQGTLVYTKLWSILKDFCQVCTEFDSTEILGLVQSLAHYQSPIHLVTMLNLVFKTEGAHSAPPTLVKSFHEMNTCHQLNPVTALAGLQNRVHNGNTLCLSWMGQDCSKSKT